MVIAPTIGWKALVTETSSDTIATAMGAVTFQMTRCQRPNELQQRLLRPVRLDPIAPCQQAFQKLMVSATGGVEMTVSTTALFYR